MTLSSPSFGCEAASSAFIASLFVSSVSFAGEIGMVSRGTGELGFADPFVAVAGVSRVAMVG